MRLLKKHRDNFFYIAIVGLIVLSYQLNPTPIIETVSEQLEQRSMNISKYVLKRLGNH